MSRGMVDKSVSVDRCMDTHSQQQSIHFNGNDDDVHSEFPRDKSIINAILTSLSVMEIARRHEVPASGYTS